MRNRAIQTLTGSVRLERYYYHCEECHEGFCPWDTQLRLSVQALSPAVQEVACIAGVPAPFAEAADKTLRKLAGLHLSESTVERATEAAGQRVADAQDEGRTFGPPTPWDWHKDAEGKSVAYVSIDATGVPQQGPEGVRSAAFRKPKQSIHGSVLTIVRDADVGQLPVR